MHSKSIYKDHATGGTEDQYLVYVLYRDGDTPHYVGATSNPGRPYRDSHNARKDHNVTSVEIVQEDLTLEDASILEDQLINHYGRSTDGGTLINQRRGGLGLKTHTDESKAKMSLASKGRTPHNKGKTHTDETKLKISASQKGRTKSDEHKSNISLAMKGRPSNRKGKTLSDEHKLKISLSSKGKTLSAEQKAKLIAANEHTSLK